LGLIKDLREKIFPSKKTLKLIAGSRGLPLFDESFGEEDSGRRYGRRSRVGFDQIIQIRSSGFGISRIERAGSKEEKGGCVTATLFVVAFSFTNGVSKPK
jgi:hypothetical protein